MSNERQFFKRVIFLGRKLVDRKKWIMAKYDGIIGQDVLTVTEGENELTIIFRDNRYLFIKVVEGKLVTDSVPE